MDRLSSEDTMMILKEIHQLVRSPYRSEREIVSEIVHIFQLYGIDCGHRNKPPAAYIIR